MTSQNDRNASREVTNSSSEFSIDNGVKADIEKAVGELGLSPDKQHRVVMTMQQVVDHHSGPLPPPQVLLQYDQALPGLAERIVAMTESELRHSQNMQVTSLQADIAERRRGQITATAITITSLVISGLVMVSGYPLTGGILGGGTILIIATSLLGGREYLLKKLDGSRPTGSDTKRQLPPRARNRKKQ